MRVERVPGPTVERSSTVTPASGAGGAFTTSLEVLGQAQVAPGDDVLLDLRRAAAHRLVHGGAIGALEATRDRRVVLVHAQLARGAADVERVAADALRERGGEQLVLRRLYGGRLGAHPPRRAHEARRERPRQRGVRRA